MRLSLVQMSSKTASRDENVERACAFVDEAARRRPDLVVLPEFFNVEYFPQYRDYRYMDSAEADDGYTQTRMKETARQHGIHILATIFEVARPGFYYDWRATAVRTPTRRSRRPRNGFTAAPEGIGSPEAAR